MDIIFPLIPLGLLWVQWFGYYSLSKSSIFSKSRKCWKLTNFAQWRNSTFRKLFFKWLPFLEKSGYWHETKARWSSKHQIFMGRKKLVDLSNHFWDIHVWKVASSCTLENQDGFPCQSRFPWISHQIRIEWWAADLVIWIRGRRIRTQWWWTPQSERRYRWSVSTDTPSWLFQS